ncbi:MAG: helicase-exonuclease AddAB subunit AddA [Oscillospiraceae bacterium]|jgi:ATP-dependent helicase/nuclease subunit A
MFQPTKEQAAAVHLRGSSLLVSAAAGSGKTKVLVERLMARLTDGAHPCSIGSFLIITYTKAAAAELRGKIIEELGKRLAADPKNRHLQRQSSLVYHAEIKTIHGFCQGLIRQNARTVGVEPDFRVGDETECDLLRRKALDRVLERQYEAMPEGAPFYDLVDLYSAGRDDRRLAEIVLDTAEKLQSHPNPERWYRQQRETFFLSNIQDAGETVWGRLLLQDGMAQCAYWEREMGRALDWILEAPPLAKGYAESFSATIEGLKRLQAAMEEGWDAAAALAKEDFFPRLGGVRGFEDPALQERVKLIRTRCKQRMTKLLEQFSAESEVLLSDLRAASPVVGALFDLVLALEEAYQAEKRRRKMLDFSDLEHIALNGLLDPETGAPTALAMETRARYEEILVDEYQDVNGVQDAIFYAVSREGENLFFVGDVKQSVYRFRLADPTLFLEKYQLFSPYEKAEQGESRRIVLSQNFRSRKEVLDATNFLFVHIMSTSFGEMEYTETEMLYPGAAFPEGEHCRVELRVLEQASEEPEDEPEEEKPGRAEGEANAVAERANALLKESFPVFDRETGRTRPITPDDIVILLRSPGTVLRHYTKALAQRGIPFVTEGGGAFLSTVEIEVMVSFLEILDNPRQDIPLISVLRSPLFGFSEDRLAQIRLQTAKGDFYEALQAAGEEMEDCRAFLDALSEMRNQATELPLDRLIWQVYNRFYVLSVFGALPGGEMRQKNLVLLADYAGQFERSEHKGLFAFLIRIRRMKENETDFGPPGGQGGHGVRIMSIHKSKGLEFPVVLLAGLSKRFNTVDLQKPILVHEKLGLGPKWLDRERMVEYPTLARLAVAQTLERELRAEELRLLYVAMTRAKEKLILFCALPGASALERYGMDAGRPMDPQVLAASPSMAGWILPLAMTRPEAGALWAAAGMAPSVFPADGSTPWDIVLEPMPGTNQVVALPAGPKEAEPEETALLWQPFFAYPHSGADKPSKLTATSLKGRELDLEAAEGAPAQQRQTKMDRPRFAAAGGLTPAERGTALHLAMQFLDYGKTGDVAAVKGELERMERMALLTKEQAAAVAPEKIVSLFRSPLGRQLRRGDVKREFKFSILVPAEDYYPDAVGEQVLLQGVIDCYWADADGVTLVDFKTDYVRPGEEAGAGARYKGQMDAYRRALEIITGKPVRRGVLYFFSTGRALELP